MLQRNNLISNNKSSRWKIWPNSISCVRKKKIIVVPKNGRRPKRKNNLSRKGSRRRKNFREDKLRKISEYNVRIGINKRKLKIYQRTRRPRG
jgi:hypothetical protein